MKIGGNGFNSSEAYLKSLCDKSFLSLWSYTNVFRQPGHELCDFLVVVGKQVIIFSDKNCEFGSTGDLNIDWKRWFRKAVKKSAEQLWGARNWIIRDTTRVFLDDKCQHILPITIGDTKDLVFHLVLVAHGTSKRCSETFGGSGSMMYFNRIQKFEQHDRPFVIGDLDIERPFIHVLDDTSLDLLLLERDTINDFTDYLGKRERLLRSQMTIFSPGEEDLLANFFFNLNDQENEYNFQAPNVIDSSVGILFSEGQWDDFQKLPQRAAQIQANKVSYMWDDIIEEFSTHAINGTQEYVSEGGFSDSEIAIRFLAQETRFQRRILSESLLQMFSTTPGNFKRIRVVPAHENMVCYAFLLFPRRSFFQEHSTSDYREIRRNYLESICMVCKLEFPEVNYVIGIAMESGRNDSSHSEDLICLDCTEWTDDLQKQAMEEQRVHQILVNPTKIERNFVEFPLN